MEREILAYIKQNRMIGKNDVVLAGVSGGSDSMAMLRILKELQGKLDFTLRVVHIHHGIRGKEADRDKALWKTYAGSGRFHVLFIVMMFRD